jgi:hypothetical protein
MPFCEGLYLYDVIQDRGQSKVGQEINVRQECGYRWRKGFPARSIRSGFLDTAASSFSTQKAPCSNRRFIYQVWAERRGSGQDGRTVRECVRRETMYTLAAAPVQTEQISEVRGKAEPDGGRGTSRSIPSFVSASRRTSSCWWAT